MTALGPYPMATKPPSSTPAWSTLMMLIEVEVGAHALRPSWNIKVSSACFCRIIYACLNTELIGADLPWHNTLLMALLSISELVKAVLPSPARDQHDLFYTGSSRRLPSNSSHRDP